MKAENGLKKCSKCGEVKGVEEYYKYSKSKDRLSYQCKECDKSRIRVYYTENRDRIISSKKIYSHSNRQKINDYYRRVYEINPIKKKISSKKSVETLVLSYVQKKIIREFEIEKSDITPIMIELKRTQLINKRLIKNLKENETE